MTRTFRLVSKFKPSGDQPKAIEKLVAGLEDGFAYQTLLGVTGSGKTFTIANVIERLQRPALILEPNKTLAAQFYSEMRDFFPKNAVEYFVSHYDYYQPEAYVPNSDMYIEKDASINDHIEQMRLSATKALTERRDVIIVATVSAIYGLGDPSSYLKMLLHLKTGDQIDQRQILQRLAELQYIRNDLKLRRATYRVLGDIIDIYPADSEREAVRVEMFDDEIENISFFDSLQGKMLRQVPQITIYPNTHYIALPEKLSATVDQIKLELTERLLELEKANKLVESQRLEQRTNFDLEMILELGYCSGIENYSHYLSGRNTGEPPPTLMDYLPKDGLLIIDESHVTIPQLGGMYRGDRARKETLIEYGFRLPSALDNRPLRFDEFEKLASQTIFISATPGLYEKQKSDQVVELLVRPTGLIDPKIEVQPIATQVDDLLSEIRKRVQKNERVLITTLTKRMAEDLTEYFSEHDVRVRYLHADINTLERVEIIRDFRMGTFDVLVGINLLREGLDIPEISLVAILDADKEGFLRSERSLIQTMGRAARHLHGKAILYADKITNSMKHAIEEAERRRQAQILYNRKHHITPKTIEKAITGIIEGAHIYTKKERFISETQQAVEEEAQHNIAMLPKQLGKYIRKLEREMYDHARNLEFEEAVLVRDKIQRIQKGILKVKNREKS